MGKQLEMFPKKRANEQNNFRMVACCASCEKAIYQEGETICTAYGDAEYEAYLDADYCYDAYKAWLQRNHVPEYGVCDKFACQLGFLVSALKCSTCANWWVDECRYREFDAFYEADCLRNNFSHWELIEE